MGFAVCCKMSAACRATLMAPRALPEPPKAAEMADRVQNAPISIGPILAVNFIGTLGFSIVLPFLVFLVTRWGGNALIYGLVGATYSAFQLVGAPLLGKWSDRHGRRKILLVSQLGTLFSWVLFVVAFGLSAKPLAHIESGPLGAFALTLPLIVVFIARALDGLTGGNVSVANAYLADITPEERRSASFGKMAVAANIGFVVGPAIAGLLASTAMGELLPVLAALLISAFASALIAFRLPESRPCTLSEDPDVAEARTVLSPAHKECFELEGEHALSAREILRLPEIPTILLAYFLVMLGFNFFYVAFPVHAATRLAWTVRETGIFFSVLGVLMVIVQGPILGRASKTIEDGALTLGGGILLAASFPMFTSESVFWIYAGAATLALGNGLMWPSLVSILSRAAGSRLQGAVQGFATSAGAIASILGLLAGGLLFDSIGEATFLISGGIILLTIPSGVRMLRMSRAALTER